MCLDPVDFADQFLAIYRRNYGDRDIDMEDHLVLYSQRKSSVKRIMRQPIGKAETNAGIAELTRRLIGKRFFLAHRAFSTNRPANVQHRYRLGGFLNPLGDP